MGSTPVALNSQTSLQIWWEYETNTLSTLRISGLARGTTPKPLGTRTLIISNELTLFCTKLSTSKASLLVSIHGLIGSIPVQEEGLFLSRRGLCHRGKDFSAFWCKGRYNLKQENKRKYDYWISITCSLISRWGLQCTLLLKSVTIQDGWIKWDAC